MALLAVTLASAGVLSGILLLGDQRRFEVVAATPADRAETPATVRSLTLTFSREPDRAAVEAAVRFEPEVAASARWRGPTLELVFEEALRPGDYGLTLAAGRLGSAGEEMQDPYTTSFRVREPGILLLVSDSAGQALVEVRGEETRELLRATRIRDYAISPDGSQIAVVPEELLSGGRPNGGLVLVDALSGQARTAIADESVDIGSVSWAADASALLVLRRDVLPSGEQGVPRTWLTRVSGEFVAQIDPEGEPTGPASWSPDAQLIAYTAPATGEVRILNLSTREEAVVGRPRGSRVTWSPDSRMVAFESVPEDIISEGPPPQPLRVVSVDGSVDRFFGEPGELRQGPDFLNATTLMSARRIAGEDPRGTELLFESVEDGRLLRSVQLAPPNDAVLSWDLDATRERIVYAVRSGRSVVVLTMDLESGDRSTVSVSGEQPRWMP